MIHQSCMLILSALFCWSSLSCSDSNSVEKEGEAYLQRAREALHNKDYAQARAEIMALRNDHPKAFNAREAGILLLDSVDLIQAQDDLRYYDSIITRKSELARTIDVKAKYEEATQKVRFFSRKLQHDLNNKRIR